MIVKVVSVVRKWQLRIDGFLIEVQICHGPILVINELVILQSAARAFALIRQIINVDKFGQIIHDVVLVEIVFKFYKVFVYFIEYVAVVVCGRAASTSPGSLLLHLLIVVLQTVILIGDIIKEIFDIVIIEYFLQE